MKTTVYFGFIIILLCVIGQVNAQEEIEVAPGISRWAIKTSANLKGKITEVSLEKLLQLPLLDAKYNDETYSKSLIPVNVTSDLKEGDMVSTEGYLYLVELVIDKTDKRDGDFFIQLTLKPEWGDSCFIVEIPYPLFVNDKSLQDICDKERAFIRNSLLNGKIPSTTGGNVMQHPVYVRVEGQLFYDAEHFKDMTDPINRVYRGKRGMHSYTAWEIHPVTNIEFAAIPEK